MKKTLLIVATLFATLFFSVAQAVQVHGFAEADSRYLSYGSDLSAGRHASLFGDIHADIWQGIGVEGYVRQVSKGDREDASIRFAHKFGSFSVLANAGHAHYDVGNNLSDKNYFKGKAEAFGVYGIAERDWGTHSSKPSVDYYTVGYERHVWSPRLLVGVEATEKNYRAEGKERFNDVALNAKYAVTKHLSVHATLAKGGTTDTDIDKPGITNVGVRYSF